VGVRIDEIPDAHSVVTREGEVAVDLARFRINQHGRAGLGAADEVRPAPTRRNLFEHHDFACPAKGVVGYYAWWFRLDTGHGGAKIGDGRLAASDALESHAMKETLALLVGETAH
jgi:hypothetical protein